jgi:Na+-translocating ferredoxin:NAD+ oxidoreductase RNF subunit RnfB
MRRVSEPILQPRNGTDESVKQEMSFEWLPAIIEEFCTGCDLCVAACGPACLETQNRCSPSDMKSKSAISHHRCGATFVKRECHP